MNKYDFDFKNIEDILKDVLGIKLTDINSLKKQINRELRALLDSLKKRNNGVSDANTKAIEKIIDEIKFEKDLEKILTKYITIRQITLLSLDYKIRSSDSYEERARKIEKRNETYALLELVNSVPSIIQLMKERNSILKHIDSENRIVTYDSEKTELPPNKAFPNQNLKIHFTIKPQVFPDEYIKVLKEADIYTFTFGNVSYRTMVNDEGDYTLELSNKELVGVIKRDEFGEIKKYAILMDKINESVPPEFYRDILFSDMALRNAKNNLGFIGIPQKDPNDTEYGYVLGFNDIDIKDFLKAIKFETDNRFVYVTSDYYRAQTVGNAFFVIQEKMDQAIRQLNELSFGKNGGR